ncbi:hypothetical protein B0H16DRAFT_1248432, partial [Mycena metata]
LEKHVREAARGKEKAWEGAGTACLHAWRIEQFPVLAWPKDTFYDGGSSIVL